MAVPPRVIEADDGVQCRTVAREIERVMRVQIQLYGIAVVVAEDAETMKANIDLLDRAFKASVKAEVEKRLGSAAPKKNPAIDKQLTKADFAKLSYSDMMELKMNDPTLFAELSR